MIPKMSSLVMLLVCKNTLLHGFLYFLCLNMVINHFFLSLRALQSSLRCAYCVCFRNLVLRKPH